MKDQYFADTDIPCHFTKFKDDVIKLQIPIFYFSADKPIHQYGYRCITRRVTQQGELLTQAGQTSSLLLPVYEIKLPHDCRTMAKYKHNLGH
jgi:hypothetical protein